MSMEIHMGKMSFDETRNVGTYVEVGKPPTYHIQLFHSTHGMFKLLLVKHAMKLLFNIVV